MRRRCFPPFRRMGPQGFHAGVPGQGIARHTGSGPADRLAQTGTEAFAMKPTRTRFQVSGFLFLLAAVTSLDRVCISTLAPEISRDLHLSKLEISFVFSAFAVAY